MGIHLRVQRNGADIPEWDWARYAGDREFCELSLPQQQHPSASHEDWIWRPIEFDLWRQAASQLPNPERFALLLDLLEADSDLWIAVSI